MYSFQIGDIVARKSYAGDISFKVVNIEPGFDGRPVYVLRGLLHRIEADSYGDDLVKQDPKHAYSTMKRSLVQPTANRYKVNSFYRSWVLRNLRLRSGRILHVDSSKELSDSCLEYYRNGGLDVTLKLSPESQQPQIIRQMLERTKADILVITGHDGIKKEAADLDSLSNYRNSSYFIESVKEARRYEPNFDRLCIFAGACQSYYEGIMGAGANFASSPGRVVINGLDPAIVSERVATTSSRRMVTPREVAGLTISGSKGIGGINTWGHLKA